MATVADDGFRGPLAALWSPDAPLDPAGLLLPPRRALPVPPASAREVWDSATGLVDRPAVADLLARAEADLGTPWPLPRASTAARVHRDGDRDAYEQQVFARQRRLSRAVVVAAVTVEDRWLDEVADGVWLLCEQSSWCWPAHDDTRAVHGAVLATVADPFLDLGAGEVVAQLAWIDQLLGDALDRRYPGIRGRIRREAHARVFEPFVRRRDWHWIGLDGDVHNWNPWIHGNVIVAALRLLDGDADAAVRDRIVALAVSGLDRYVASLPTDGAIDEGYAYWWNGACRALEALEVLQHATGGAWDWTGVTALRETVAFPHRSHLGGAWYVNHADGQARPPADQPWHALHRAARRIGDGDAVAHAAAHRGDAAPAATEREGLGRLLRGITDAAWVTASPVPAPLVRDVWLESTQVLLARERAGTAAGLTLVAKGGHNGEHHNHDDVGSFIVAVDGVPAVVDAGRPTYTAATFGPDRYSIWTMQSSWHNVPEIRGTAQPPGSAFRAGEVRATQGDDAAFEAELAAAYPVPGLRSWRRRAELARAASRVVVTDSWRLDAWEGPGPEPATVLHLLLHGDARLERGTAVVSPPGARAVRLRWPTDAAARLEPRELDDPLLAEVWGPRLTRLEIDVTDRADAWITVELENSR